MYKNKLNIAIATICTNNCVFPRVFFFKVRKIVNKRTKKGLLITI